MMATTESQVIQTPISRLPNELLTSIFLICKNIGFRTPYNLTLITISQVSRQWRAVSIGYPDLWTNINTNYPRWAEELLQRSQNALIHIYSPFTVANSNHVVAIQMALREIHRVKGLTLIASPATSNALFDALPDAAPYLEHLELEAYEIFDDLSHLILFEGVTSSRGAVRSTTHMRHLELKGFQMKWETPFLRGLTHLSLGAMSFVVIPTLPKIIDVLQSMPLLEYLHFGCHITASGNVNLSPETPTNQIAQLPHLTSLEFLNAFGLMACTHVMEHLMLPSNCRIRIKLRNYLNPHDSDLGMYLKRLLDAIMIPKLVLPEEQVFPIAQVNFSGTFLLRLSHYPAFDNNVGKHSPFIELGHIQLIGTRENTICMLKEALRLPYLESIFVGTSIVRRNPTLNVGRSFWKVFLPNLLYVRQVEVGGNSAFSFLNVLLSLDAKHALAGIGSLQQFNSGVCLPLLENIEIRSTDFQNALCHSFSLEKLNDLFTRKFVYRPNFRGISFINCYNLKVDDVQPLVGMIDIRWVGQYPNDRCETDDEDSSDGIPDSDDD